MMIRLKPPLASIEAVALNPELCLRGKGLYTIVRVLAKDAQTTLTLAQVVAHTGLTEETISGLLGELAASQLVVTR
jgi:hypothetical protein